MRRFRCLMLMIVLLSFAGLACAGPGEDGEAPKRPRGTADVVQARAVPPIVNAAPGTAAVFEVVVDIAKTWHLYSHEYNEDPESFFIGVDLKLPEDSPFDHVEVVYPEAEEGTFMGEKVMMLHGTLTLQVTVDVPDVLTEAQDTIELLLTAQACDDKICLAPADIPVSVELAAR